MKAAAFVRYRSGDGFGHVGWAFEVGDGRVNAGSVENHSGHLFTPAPQMGFWNGCFADPVDQMRARRYDDLKWIDVPHPDPMRAYATVLWIEHQAYRALFRNCEDDAYDVLRAYGVEGLPPPMFAWLPKTWFSRFHGVLERLPDYRWRPTSGDSQPLENAVPWRPTWRRPWHPDFHALKLTRVAHLGRAWRL